MNNRAGTVPFFLSYFIYGNVLKFDEIQILHSHGCSNSTTLHYRAIALLKLLFDDALY